MDKIIACIDGSVLANDVCHAGVWVSKALSKPLMFLHTIERQQQHGADDLTGAIGLGARSALLAEMASLDEQRGKVALQLSKGLFEHVVQLANDQDCELVEQKQRHGDFVDALIELEKEARLIVVGRSGEGHQQDFKALGSHIEHLIRQVHTPVLIATKDFAAPTNFMLAYDGRATADKAVERIISGGLLHGMTCHLVTIKNNESAIEQKFQQTAQRLREQGFDVKAEFIEGEIFASLDDYKMRNNIELIVMGAFGHSKIRQFFLGSNTLRTIESSQIPLIVLR